MQSARRRLREHRPRRGIPLPFLCIIVALGVLPLLLVGLRVLALAGHSAAFLSLSGDWLNQHFSLLWIAAEDRTAILHVVQLPLAALLVAITRLSLGIRVLGFRAILIAIGMREVGILPSLVLIAIIAACVVLVRPLMRRSGMPLYARVSSILSIVAATMVAGLLLGTTFDSAILSSFAFFPVVILAMLAESIADSVARENIATAAWRTGATIVLALLIALVASWPLLSQLALACPELIMTQLVLVILVSEFADWRLLEDFRPGDTAEKPANGLCIAVVRNRWSNTILRHTGGNAPRRYRLCSVQALVDALRGAGHTVAVLEADARLYNRLRDFIPGSALGNTPGALVINYAGGVQGTGRLCQVPSLCEMIGVPYTGPDPLAMAAISDQLLLAQTLAAHHLPALALREPGCITDAGGDAAGPWLVLHRFQSDREALRAQGKASLARAVRRIVAAGDRPLIARAPVGRMLRVIVMRGETEDAAPQVLPPLESQTPKRRHGVARLDQHERAAVEGAARRVFIALRCRDIARIDLWLDSAGVAGVVGVRVVDLLSPRGDAAFAAAAAGIPYPVLITHFIACHVRPMHQAPAAFSNLRTLPETA